MRLFQQLPAPRDAQAARIWIPLPLSDEAQTVSNLRVDAPLAHRIGTESQYGNKILFLEAKAPLPETIPITLAVEVEPLFS